MTSEEPRWLNVPLNEHWGLRISVQWHEKNGYFKAVAFAVKRVNGPESLSHHMQEVEAEWLRLGTLLEQLRKLEKV